ncbi:hypothetical protein BROUX41_001532 [Berkeleyomyces rouxiae]|uniref:uncharacterized protein n=1 Tax=Berkeleyomyces rouxiae TaxID=2035830 RepID=UPI003B7FCE40
MSDTNWLGVLGLDRHLQGIADFAADSRHVLAEIEPTSYVLLLLTFCGFLLPLAIILPPLPLKFSEALVQTHTLLTVRTSRAGNAPAGSAPRASTLHSQLAQASEPPAAEPPTANLVATSSKIDRLCVYPVVPCRGIELAKSKIVRRGMQYDSIYAFVEQAPGSKTWDLLLPTTCPNLDCLSVEIWVPDIIKTRGSLDKAPNEAFIIVSFPWVDRGWQGLVALLLAKLTKGLRAKPDKEVLLPVEFPTDGEIRGVGYQYEPVRMADRSVRLLNMGRELPAELARFLGATGKLGIARVDRCLDGDNGTREIRALCMLPEKLEEKSSDWVVRRPNVTVSQTLPQPGRAISKINFEQGDAMFSSDWSYHVCTYTDGALQLVPQPSAEESDRIAESWLEVGMGVVIEQKDTLS